MDAGFQAKVKSILSGDTLVLHALQNFKQERILSLAYVTAPRLKRDGDEPFAFESRDYLRKALVDKVVTCRVLYTIPTSNRQYGVVELANGARLPDDAVHAGWLKLRDDAGRKDNAEETSAMLEKLKVLEARAKAESRGLWAENPEAGRIDTDYELPDTKAFVEEYKGKPLDTIVEKVLAGDRLIARFMLSPTKHVQTMLLIAGIRAPSTKRVNPSDGKEQPAEPFGDAAQEWVDQRLIQRSVTVDVLGVSPAGQLIGTVKHRQRGSVAPHILSSGLARCADHHSTLLGAEMGELRKAEKAAKDGRIGVFHGHVAPKTGGKGELEGVVSRIFSADTIFLRTKESAEDRRINISSIRQPKPSDPKQAPWGAEAKEFLRKRLVGKHVRYTIDGKRAATDGYEEREVATVIFNKENVGKMMVKSGFASVIRHRQDDPDRSPIYDELLVAEAEAQAEGKGMWNAKSPAAKQYVDYSESLEKAKRQLALLSRRKKVAAVVDFVKSGSRFTVLIPSENAKITLVLSGIRAPKSARNKDDKAEPWGNEAHEFAHRRCLQRDVEIDVEDCDKVGGFIGTLFINRENFTKLLVEEGLASVHQYSAEKSGNATELNAAESKAKEQRKGLWEKWDPSQDAELEAVPEATNGSNGDAVSIERRKDYRDVVVTDIGPDGKLKLQQVGTGTAALTELMNAFRSFHLNPANKAPLPNPPKAGDFVASQFSEDKEWYRAKIRRNDRENKKAEVVYIDYGNSEVVPWSNLRPLSQAQFSTQKLKPQASEAVLAFVQFPTSPGYLKDAIDFLYEVTGNKQLVANVDHTAEGTLHVTLLDPKQGTAFKDSINVHVVAEGCAMVPKKLKPWERAATDVWTVLKQAQDTAKEERKGMWEYGDITQDDD
ncbi:hypothetical protein EJ05DRAFT_475285 [Pseudovirgaria hyperparasitica]|uniref:Probable endonuclease LCL3 n=1 Tax=Pseudovirgaria hyperparasitica TaxID=470096 RepID=A0A6A6W873_9PEZI|nr:uncharacterized protein EJ05DRAFT_475285 [Pseudovirgaria hyperparasitica]KAF2759052.1 hypothetical protein EJ05DRAFT_475285 [Pseudovirgaria hyperparasitica]